MTQPNRLVGSFWRTPGLLVLISIVLCAGCASSPTEGYSFGGTFRDDVATVAVNVFETDSLERGVELELTDAVIKQIEARTPYKVTASTRADSILIGRIRRVERQVLSRSPLTGLNEEVVLQITIDFTWTDLRSGQPLVERLEFTGGGLYTPSNPVGEPAEIGQFAAVEQLATAIVDQMRSDW